MSISATIKETAIDAPISDEATKAFWAKCNVCNHIWAAAYYPMDAMKFAKIASRCQCPKCGERKKVGIAKQDNGVLQEAM